MIQKKIALINYGMGNIGSIVNVLKYLNANFFVCETSKKGTEADAFILPGVGAFPAAMKNLNEMNFINTLNEEVLLKNKPYLGICLGMQILALDSTEKTLTKGLGWINGHVIDLHKNNSLPVPHVGWNDIEIVKKSPLFHEFHRIETNSHFYFDHSFHLKCDDKYISATCDYGMKIVAAIQWNNIFGSQFHPEKSQRNGLKMIRNYLSYINNL